MAKIPHFDLRGIGYTFTSQFDKAIADYNKAIELKLDYAQAYNNRGGVWIKKGDYEKAIDDFNKAIEINPKYTGAYYNRGDAYFSLDNKSSACDDWRKACELGNCEVLNWAKKEGACQQQTEEW